MEDYSLILPHFAFEAAAGERGVQPLALLTWAASRTSAPAAVRVML